MNIIYVLISLSVLVFILSILFFFWAVNNEQYEDLDAPAHNIILDDKKENKNVNNN